MTNIYHFKAEILKNPLKRIRILKLKLICGYLTYLNERYPESSVPARILAFISIFVVVLSTVLFCMETLTMFDWKDDHTMKRHNLRDPFFIVESICIMWFCVELIVRFISSPVKTAFILDIMNIIDFVAILPYFLTLMASSTGSKTTGKKGMC